jgi:hypothetical protein
MQKMFILQEDGFDTLQQINNYIKDNGRIISVTPNKISSGGTGRYAGKWLVVAENKGALQI